MLRALRAALRAGLSLGFSAGLLALGALTAAADTGAAGTKGPLLMSVGVWELRLQPVAEGESYACGARAGSDEASFWLWIHPDGLVELGFGDATWPDGGAEVEQTLHVWLQIDNNPPWEVEEAWLGPREIGFLADSTELAVAFMAELTDGQEITLRLNDEEELARHAINGAPAAVEGLMACVSSLVKTIEPLSQH